jgi:hypothetical protein
MPLAVRIPSCATVANGIAAKQGLFLRYWPMERPGMGFSKLQYCDLFD